MKWFFVSFSLAAVAGGALLFGCASSGNTGSTTQRLSRKGEACQYANECADGLSCLPRPNSAGGICVTGEFKVEKTAKECALIQCDAPADCCPPPPSNCAQLDQECKAGGTSAQYYCQQYQQECVCDVNAYKCDNGACRYEQTCTTNEQCTSGSCVGGRCAECTTNANCYAGATCVNNQCVSGCSLDSDCPSFNRCQNGTCVPGTCQSDRECVAATGNVEAKCNGDEQRCVVPCQSDLECGSSQDYKFYSCINNECVYTGCDSDKECEFYFGKGGGTGTASTSSSSGNPYVDGGTNPGYAATSSSYGKTRIVCRDKQDPAATN